MVNFEENYHFSRFRRGPTFSRGGGGSNFFQAEGGQLLIPYRNRHNLWFSRVSGHPAPSLDPHLNSEDTDEISHWYTHYFLLLINVQPSADQDNTVGGGGGVGPDNICLAINVDGRGPNLYLSREVIGPRGSYRQITTLKDFYKFTFFPRTIIHWNALPHHIPTLPTLAQFNTAVCRVAHSTS